MTIRKDSPAVESSAPALARLKPREAAFALALAAGVDQTAAAVFAGAPKRSASSRGSEMAARPRVQNAVAALRAEAARESGMTPAEVLRLAREDRGLAFAKGAPAAAIRATEIMAKVVGVLTARNDRQRVTVRVIDFTGKQLVDVETESSGGDDE